MNRSTVSYSRLFVSALLVTGSSAQTSDTEPQVPSTSSWASATLREFSSDFDAREGASMTGVDQSDAAKRFYAATGDLIWDNGPANGINGIRPYGGWTEAGLIDNFDTADACCTPEVAHFHVELIDGTFPLGVPDTTHVAMRVRIFEMPSNGMNGLVHPDEPNGDQPVFDQLFTRISGGMNVSDSGIDMFDRDLLYMDALCYQSLDLEPNEEYVLYVNFPGSGYVDSYMAFSDHPCTPEDDCGRMFSPGLNDDFVYPSDWAFTLFEGYQYIPCCDDFDPCCMPIGPCEAPYVIHGTGQPGETRPYSGYIDPRSESDNGVDINRGIDRATMLFSRPVFSPDGGPVTAEDFRVFETDNDEPPDVISVDASQNPMIEISLSRIITPENWTTIQAIVEDSDGTPIINMGDQGTESEPDRIDIGFLPGDTDQNEHVTPTDLLRFREIVNDMFDPPLGTPEDFADVDRNGEITPFDLLSYRQLINGIPPATESWIGNSLNDDRP